MEKSERYITECEIESLQYSHSKILVLSRKEENKGEICTTSRLNYLQALRGIEKQIVLKTLSLYGIKEYSVNIDVPPHGHYIDDPEIFYFHYKSLCLHISSFRENLEGIMYRKSINKKQEKYIKFNLVGKIHFLNEYLSKNKRVLNLGYKKIKRISEEERDLKLFVQVYEDIVKKPFRESLFKFIKPHLINNFGKVLQDCCNYRPFEIHGPPSKTIRAAIKIAVLPLEKVKEIQDGLTIVIKTDETLEDKLKKADHI